MARLTKFLATAGGLGYCPVGSGTAGSVLGLGIGLSVLGAAQFHQWTGLVLFIGLAIGVSGAAERLLAQHDPRCVVIDEVAGMWLTIACVPWLRAEGWGWVLAAFALFRLFDIVKPPPLKWFARAPAGWGIVLDDLGAAVYSAAVLWGLHAGLLGR